MVLMRGKASARPWLILSAVVIALDQLTKHLALANLRPYESREVIPGLFNWTLAFNPGQTQRIAFNAAHPGKWLMQCMGTKWNSPRRLRWYEVS